MHIRDAQTQLAEYIDEIGYREVEKTPAEAFLHLVEEVGETARSLLHSGTARGKMSNTTVPKELEEEVADVFWQTLKLAVYLDIDLEGAFEKKFAKNRARGKTGMRQDATGARQD